MSVLEMVMSAPLVKGQIVSLGELRKDQVEQQQNYREFVALQASLTYDLEKQGHYHVAPLNQKVFLLCIFFLILDLMIPIMMKSVAWTTVNLFLFPLGVIALLVFVLGRRRRTRIGYEVQDYLKGFKLFLEMTEKERYDFHNAPEKSPEQFMEYLPYAIAFGVEEKWAKVFEGITIPNPGWYDGGSVHSFSAVNLTTSLGAFSTVFAASSGASPSSGGGHSGGGSGGGGGGSW
jgi:uncharacterized membrane protein